MASHDLPPAALLAFDTSTQEMAVALRAGAAVWFDDQPGGAAASAALLPTIDALLQRAGLRIGDLDAIAFGRGPGAFTGLRTSCAVAQGLAVGTGVPLLPIDSLLIVAEQARRQLPAADPFEVGVAADARMGEVYAGRYRWSAGTWQEVEQAALWSPAALAADWSARPPPAVCGSAIALFEVLRPATAVHVAVGGSRAEALLALAAQAWLCGAGVDAADALPVYLRDKVAQTTAERSAAAAPSVAAR